MESEPPKVFISYNRADRDWAEWIAGAIDRSGYQPIIEAWDFRPGENFVLRMDEAAKESDLTLAVLSGAYLQAAYTQPEWAAAFAPDPIGKKRRFIPVRVAECTVTGLLSQIIYIDLVNIGEQDAERALLDGLKPSGKPAQPPTFPGKRAEPSISTAPFPPSITRLHNVPDLPPQYWNVYQKAVAADPDNPSAKEALLRLRKHIPGDQFRSPAVGSKGQLSKPYVGRWERITDAGLRETYEFDSDRHCSYEGAAASLQGTYVEEAPGILHLKVNGKVIFGEDNGVSADTRLRITGNSAHQSGR